MFGSLNNNPYFCRVTYGFLQRDSTPLFFEATSPIPIQSDDDPDSNLTPERKFRSIIRYCVPFLSHRIKSTADERKKARQSSDYQAFSSVGVTGFEPATTRPPELSFTFSNKFNELYSSGFYTYSTSCNLPLSGVVAISRVPPVFHTPSAYPIKIEK